MIFPKCVYKFVDDNLGVCIILFTLTLMAGLCVFLEYSSNRRCETYSIVTGKPTKHLWSECYILVNGEWLTYKERLNTLIARDAISE